MIRILIVLLMAGFSACSGNDSASEPAEEIPAEVRSYADSTVKIINENISHHSRDTVPDTIKTQ